MGGVDAEDTLVGVIAPAQIAAGTHQALEDLGMMTGVEHHQTHAMENTVTHAGNHFIGYFVMTHMTPQDEHIGGIEHLIGQTGFGHVQGGNADIGIGDLTDDGGNGAVQTFGMDFHHLGLGFFVQIFIPYGNIHDLASLCIEISLL